MRKALAAPRFLAPFAAAILLCAALLALAGCAGPEGSSSESSSSSDAPAAEAMSGIHHAVIEVEGYDPITVELDADAAPNTVANFAALADQGYYDGLSFYRIVDGFCLQGGTKGNSAAGHDPALTPIQGEFSSNGVENPLAEEFGVGTVAMARTSDPDSATSTFFVTLGANPSVGPSLDGQYAAFGTIDEEGMEVIDAIVADHLSDVDDPQMGAISDEAAQPRILSIKMVD